MNQLEQDLKAQPRRALPTEWREEILSNAAVRDSATKHRMVAWFIPQWLRYGMAAAWSISLALHLMTPNGDSGKASISTTNITDSDHPMMWALAIKNYHDDNLIN